MSNKFDIKILNAAVIEAVESTFKKMLHVDAKVPPVVVERPVIEYESRMRIFPMEKFNGPAYVAYVNLYLTQKDAEAQIVKGTFVIFIKEDIVEKLLKSFGLSMQAADDENVLLDNVGEFCHIIAANVTKELAEQGYAELIVSAPGKAKNSLPEGVPFDYGLFSKQEFSFTYWNQKCFVVEACAGDIPVKGK